MKVLRSPSLNWKPKMEREDFVKKRFKAYQLIEFQHAHMPDPVECMLVAVNFDTEILTLRPFPDSNPFEQDEFPVHISQCKIAGHKLKVTDCATEILKGIQQSPPPEPEH